MTVRAMNDEGAARPVRGRRCGGAGRAANADLVPGGLESERRSSSTVTTTPSPRSFALLTHADSQTGVRLPLTTNP